MKKNLAMKLVLALALTVSLASCSGAAEVSGDFVDIALVDSKAPTQLLRNESAGRIPTDAIDEIVKTGDTSVACLPSDVDANETIRSWQSSIRVSLTSEYADQLDDLVRTLVGSYEDQGWAASALGGTGRGGSKLLFSETVLQSIQVVGLEPNEERPETLAGDPIPSGSILIVVTGPCVRTDGRGSDEVEQLEI